MGAFYTIQVFKLVVLIQSACGDSFHQEATAYSALSAAWSETLEPFTKFHAVAG